MPKANTRKRPREDEHQLSYARRLVHQCRKELHKQAKICRNFECQRLSRKLKQEQKESQATLLQKWRHLPIGPVMELCFRRLGMLDLVQTIAVATLEKGDETKTKKRNDKHSKAAETKPSEEITESSNKDEGTASSDTEKNGDNDVDESMLEKILGQKKMRDAMEEWSVKVAEYRKWCARQQGTFSNDKIPVKKTTEDEDEVNNPVDASHSLFMTLGKQDEGNKKKKKNRPGQKARQAKSAESTTTTSQSQQWNSQEGNKQVANEALHPSWEARKTQRASIASFQGKKITFGAENNESHITNKTANPDAGEDLHPSWEARKTQKNSIVAFQGKKITFD